MFILKQNCFFLLIFLAGLFLSNNIYCNDKIVLHSKPLIKQQRIRNKELTVDENCSRIVVETRKLL